MCIMQKKKQKMKRAPLKKIVKSERDYLSCGIPALWQILTLECGHKLEADARGRKKIGCHECQKASENDQPNT